MPRRPNDPEPDPLGGRAAERLREELMKRYSGGLPPSEEPADGKKKDTKDDKHEGTG